MNLNPSLFSVSEFDLLRSESNPIPNPAQKGLNLDSHPNPDLDSHTIEVKMVEMVSPRPLGNIDIFLSMTVPCTSVEKYKSTK